MKDFLDPDLIDQLIVEARDKQYTENLVDLSNLDRVREELPDQYRHLADDWFYQMPQSLELRITLVHAKQLIALVIEDDTFLAKAYERELRSLGYQAIAVYGADDALRVAAFLRGSLSLVLVDIRMETGDFLSRSATSDGYHTGAALIEEIRNFCPDVNLVVVTQSNDQSDRQIIERFPPSCFCWKGEYPPEQISGFIRREIIRKPEQYRSFIIHGHNHQAASDLQILLQVKFGFQKPEISMLIPSRGSTVIEKVEEALYAADFVFALLTPDDIVDTGVLRARQNVILEIGMAIGNMGRKSGRLFLLVGHKVELPSDLAGVITVDITNGIESAADILRIELGDYID